MKTNLEILQIPPCVRPAGQRVFPICLFAIAFLAILAPLGWSAEQAYTDSITQVKQSFHWDHATGSTPEVATTPRVLLDQQPSNLTTLNFDPGNSSLYRTQTIQGISTNCVLVSTFTQNTSIWTTAAPNQDLQFHNVSPSYDIFPWVTAGNTLKDYFSTNYASTLTTGNVDRRIFQTLGMPDQSATQSRVLAFFWAPIDLLLRPAYSADISTQINYAGLPTVGNGSFTSYAVANPAAGGSSYQFQDYNYTTYSGATGFGDFMMNNEAKTAMPWTAMGYTYNWNSLEDGLNGRALDPNRVNSYVGPSEFVLSAGSWVKFDHFVENAGLYTYLVPEASSIFLLLFAGIAIFCLRRYFPFFNR